MRNKDLPIIIGHLENEESDKCVLTAYVDNSVRIAICRLKDDSKAKSGDSIECDDILGIIQQIWIFRKKSLKVLIDTLQKMYDVWEENEVITEKEWVEHFANECSKRMNDLDMTQRELAEKTGITEVTISRYMHGKRIPKADTIVKIAEAVGVHRATIYKELERGGTPYRAEVAQKTL